MREKPGSFLMAIVDHVTAAVGYAVIAVIAVCLGVSLVLVCGGTT